MGGIERAVLSARYATAAAAVTAGFQYRPAHYTADACTLLGPGQRTGLMTMS